jgi:hypothetical protein
MRVPGFHGSSRLTFVALCAAMLAPSVARGQALEPDQAPAHLAYVDGAASLDREGTIEPAGSGVPFVPGDRLRTDAGRVEVLFPDGSILDVDQFTSVDILSQTLLRVGDGRVLLTVAGAGNPAAAVRFQVDTPTASVVTDGPGEYRVALFSGPAGEETELAVVRGFAALTTERGSINVRAGERSVAPVSGSPSYPQVFNSARYDAFARWADARRLERSRTTASTPYLPNELQMYGSAFDRYGAWRHEPSYGYVWYPSVAFDWRPYYYGYWSSIRPLGWTWIGFDAWAWPTHHYGRWGHAHNRWFWIPKPHWGAAWVSWGAAPGYVSWCPLGFDGRPVFGPRVVAAPWAGWVVVPRTHFATRHVNQWAVAPHRLHRNTTFTYQATPPVAPTYAVRRDVVGNGVTSGRVATAVPRNAPSAGQQIAGGFSQRSAEAAPRARSQQAAGRQGFDGFPARVDRNGPSAVPRRPPISGGVESPPASPPQALDRTGALAPRPAQGQVWLTEPLPGSTRTYQRRATAPQSAPPPDTDAAGRQLRSAVPRWSLPGSPANSESMRSAQPSTTAPAAAPPRWRLPGSSIGGGVQTAAESAPAAVPRWGTPGGSVRAGRSPEPAAAPAQRREGYGAASRSGSPADSAPRAGTAVPRSGSPPPASTSGDRGGGPASRANNAGGGAGNTRGGGNGGNAGGGGGVRQRHP